MSKLPQDLDEMDKSPLAPDNPITGVNADQEGATTARSEDTGRVGQGMRTNSMTWHQPGDV